MSVRRTRVHAHAFGGRLRLLEEQIWLLSPAMLTLEVGALELLQNVRPKEIRDNAMMETSPSPSAASW